MKLLSTLIIIGVLSKVESRWLENGESRIMYGELVDIKDYPYMVRVQAVVLALVSTCGGALITARTVLTAAHCVFDERKPYSTQDVAVDILITGERISSSTIIPHEEFKIDSKNPLLTVPNDIAVIHLESCSTYNYEFPVLNHKKYFQTPGTTFEVIGYGVTEDGTLSDYLRGTELRISSQKHPFRYAFYALSDISASCSGDSGGPAIVHSGPEHILVGIVSGGPYDGRTCPVKELESYTSVFDFHEWIKRRTMMMNCN